MFCGCDNMIKLSLQRRIRASWPEKDFTSLGGHHRRAKQLPVLFYWHQYPLLERLGRLPRFSPASWPDRTPSSRLWQLFAPASWSRQPADPKPEGRWRTRIAEGTRSPRSGTCASAGRDLLEYRLEGNGHHFIENRGRVEKLTFTHLHLQPALHVLRHRLQSRLPRLLFNLHLMAGRIRYVRWV